MHIHSLRRTALSALLAVTCSTALSAQTAYHDQSLGYHLGRSIALRSAGYKPVSLDVAGDHADQHWTAVWLPAPGVDWTGNFGMTFTEFSQWRGNLRTQGYRDDLITTAGSGSSVVYGAVMVRDGLQSRASIDAPGVTFDNSVGIWHREGWLPNSISVHGTAADPRYTIVLVENPGKIRWGYSRDKTASEYQQVFNAFVTGCRARPAFVTAGAFQRYTSIFRDDPIGSWTARHNLTKAGYESEVASLGQLGFEPLQVTCAGVGAAARYAALFRAGSAPAQNVSATGNVVPALAAIDDLMMGTGNDPGFLRDRNARAAGIAITKNGRLVFARGYTYGPSGTETVYPTSGFRVASLSKPVAAMALYHRMQRDPGITLDSKLVDMGSFGTPADPRTNDIRIHHLLDHSSGYNPDWSANTTDKWARARSELQGRMLDSDPGAVEVYSNGGYQMLSMALEGRTGRSYWDYVSNELFAPLGIQNAHMITSAPVAGDLFCQEARWGGSRQLAISNNFAQPGSPLTNDAYAVHWQSMDGSGGLVMSPIEYVRLLSGVFDESITTGILNDNTRGLLQARIEATGRTGGFDSASARNVNGRIVNSYEKGGLWRSSHTYGVYRTDGIAIAAFCTSPGAPDIDAIQAIVDAVETAGTWPTNDLFPTYGFAAFPRRSQGISQAYGIGCGGVVQSTQGLPEIGSTQTFLATGVSAGRPAQMFLGVSSTQHLGFRLPLDLGLFGASGCTLLTSPVVSVGVITDAFNRATVPIRYPNDLALVGTRFYTQFAVAVPRVNPLGTLFSGGMRTTLGR